MTETPLQMAQRHVAEGTVRIARQEALIAELESHGHERMLADAHSILTNMQDTQRLGEEHLARLITQGRRPIFGD